MITLNWQIDLGSIIAAGSVIVTLILLHGANVRRITRIETQVHMMYRWWERRQNGEE